MSTWPEVSALYAHPTPSIHFQNEPKGYSIQEEENLISSLSPMRHLFPPLHCASVQISWSVLTCAKASSKQKRTSLISLLTIKKLWNRNKLLWIWTDQAWTLRPFVMFFFFFFFNKSVNQFCLKAGELSATYLKTKMWSLVSFASCSHTSAGTWGQMNEREGKVSILPLLPPQMD